MLLFNKGMQKLIYFYEYLSFSSGQKQGNSISSGQKQGKQIYCGVGLVTVGGFFSIYGCCEDKQIIKTVVLCIDIQTHTKINKCQIDNFNQLNYGMPEFRKFYCLIKIHFQVENVLHVSGLCGWS